MSNNISLSQEQIKEWLEWAVKADLLFKETTYEVVKYFGFGDGFNVADDIKSPTASGQWIAVYNTLQLILQDEIQRQGWFFHLRTHNEPEVLVVRVINDGKDFDCIAASRASTIPEAFMLAFRQAWEVTHG